LLSGAALSGEEWRSILASTNNQLNYDAVSSALNILFDEQMQHPRAHHSGQGHHNLHTVEEDSDWSWQDDSWDWSDPWANMAWENGDWHAADDDPGEEECAGATNQPPSEGSQEAMAADWSWSQAQRTSQQIRKDRGFGQSSSNPSSMGCFNCGGNHRVRDCPDRNAPSNKGKGYGKHLHYTMDEPYDNFAFFKGKSKGKPGGKMAYMFEEFYTTTTLARARARATSRASSRARIATMSTPTTKRLWTSMDSRSTGSPTSKA